MLLCFQDVRQRNRSPNSLESVSSSTDSAYSETASSPASSSGDERLLDDVDEEYSSGGYKYSYYEIATHLSSLNFSWNGILEVSILKCVFFDFWLFFNEGVQRSSKWCLSFIIRRWRVVEQNHMLLPKTFRR